MIHAAKHNRSRRGYSLLELVITTAIMAAVVTSTVTLMRGSYNVWQARDSDAMRLEGGHAIARHLIRELRQAKEVIEISLPAVSVGVLSVLDAADNKQGWQLSGNAVQFGGQTLADSVAELHFTGYEADGQTPTTVLTDIRCVQADIVVELDRTAEKTRTIQCRAWLRAW